VLDVVTANGDSNDVAIRFGMGARVFFAAQFFSVGEFPTSVALGDVDGDGVLDVVTANMDSNDVSILLGNGNGTFFSDQRFNLGDRPVSVVLGDVESDRLDVNRDSFLNVVTVIPDRGVQILLRDTSLKDIPHTAQYERVTVDGRDQLVFYLTLQKDIPLGPNRTVEVQAFLPNSSEPNFIGRITQTISSRETPVVVILKRI
jgi:hypothetical protein